jgi:LmbE family N-acetylglucosaminyl deacetylase
MFGRRILVCVAHPDDEVVACAAAIGRARTEGAAVFALYLTDGCLARETQWPWLRRRRGALVARRRAEAERAAAELGLTPVGWAARPARGLWRALGQARAEIKAAVKACAADQLWVPAYEGGNPDHDGLNAIGRSFADRMSVLEFAEYNFFGGRACAQRFPAADGAETTLRLSPEERARKAALLRLYASERGNLGYVGVETECWRPLAPYDYARPPHPGRLWYARFQWVPFRHPRVDFTRPEQVSAAIVAFLGQSGASPRRRAGKPGGA